MKLFKKARTAVRVAVAALGVLALAACDASLSPLSQLRGSGDSVKVALLVPYGSATPGDDSIARSLESAARMALEDSGNSNIELTVFSTGGQAATAAAAASQAASQGANIILGPLRSDAANAAAVAVRGDGLNVLAFSNNASIAGGNLFVLGTTFDTISNRLMGYAARQGRNQVVIVNPNTPVGEIARNSMVRAASATGVNVAGTTGFEFSQNGIVDAVPSVAATVRSSNANAMVLTSDSAGALPLLAQLLAEGGVDPAQVKYIGLTRWDIPPQNLGLAGLQGGWFALPDPAGTQSFNSRFQLVSGGAPHILAPLAYDGMAAITTLASNGLPVDASNLTRPSGFSGATGIFRILSNGTNERALAVAQVTNSQVQIIDPAPRTFGFGGS